MRIVLLLVALAGMVQAQTWTNLHGTGWARLGDTAISCQSDGQGRYAIRHTGAKDWALNGFQAFKVEPGEECVYTCTTAPLDGNATAVCSPGFIARDAENKVVDWMLLSETLTVGQTYEKRFLVPDGVFSLLPRVSGTGPFVGVLGPCVFTRTGRRRLVANPRPLVLESAALMLTVMPTNGAFTVKDKRTGRVWATDLTAKGSGLPRGLHCVSAFIRGTKAIELSFGDADLAAPTRRIVFELKDAEFVVTLDFGRDTPQPQVIRYPAPLTTRKGDRLIVCKNEGMGYPVDEDHEALRGGYYACGYWLSMPFFGIVEDATGAGCMTISEDHEDGTLETYRLGRENLWSAGPGWVSEKGTFSYPRHVRYVFTAGGGHVALAKRFRAWAKDSGWLKTFREKAIRRPQVERLLGAPNIWAFFPDKEKLAHAQELKALGIDRFLWSSGGNEATVTYLAGLENVLVSRYDNTQDVFHPKLMERMGKKGQKGLWHEAFPRDCMWTGTESNSWRKAWGIEVKEGTNVVLEHCATMCDARAPFYERAFCREELKTKPYNTRFMDTTFSEPWKECFCPQHPMNRRESRLWRLELLRTLQNGFGLVTGSERGSASTVPVCDYFEGMMSIAGCGLPRAGRDMALTWTNELPTACARYAVNPVYRLPLWELVYHDCSCAHWYWGDGNCKAPEIWEERDLMNALYATSALFLYTKAQWPGFRDRIVSSYKRISPVVRAAGFNEMTDHRILTQDRLVQRTIFANGVAITVNFSSTPWTDENGRILAAHDFLVTGISAR